MANITTSLLKKNAGATVTPVNGAASQTVDYTARSDSNLLMIFNNTTAAPCRIKVKNGGVIGAGAPDLDVDIAAGAQAGIGHLESTYFKSPTTGAVTFEILDQDDSGFSGAVADVKVSILELPKALIN